MIKKEIIDTVLSPFLIVRPVPYTKKDEYAHLQEEPTEIYISSAYYKAHWMWDFVKLSTVDFLNGKDSLMIAFDYSVTMKYGIRTRKQLIKEKKKLDSTAFEMEYNNIMVGISENAYFTFDMLNKAQKIKKAFYPRVHIDVIEKKKNKYDIPKQSGEIRIVSCDISMIKGNANDNSVFTCIRAIPNKDFYERQVSYIHTMNGGNTTDQAIMIKRLFEDFNADYIVLDTQNSGINVFDELGKVLYDDERDVEYPAYTCFNDEDTAQRIKNKNAIPIVYSFKGNATINHEMHMYTKDAFEKNKIKLLINSTESKDYFEDKRYYTMASPEEKVKFDLPYTQTELLINEMINLSYEINTSSNKIKLVEPRTGRKDRYVSLAMGMFLISTLERDLTEQEENNFLDYCLW